MHRTTLVFAATLLSALAARAQTITVRDTIVALPPISFCQDGATHRTTCTNLRLRPGALASLAQFVGQPLEITGTPGAITCPFVTVQTVSVIGNSQFAVPSTTATSMTVEFFGTGPVGDVFLLFVAPNLQATPSTFPPFFGPVHLDPATTIFLGVFAPLGTTTPYHSLTFPFNPALVGFDLFDQALAVHGNGTAETTPVDCFAF